MVRNYNEIGVMNRRSFTLNTIVFIPNFFKQCKWFGRPINQVYRQSVLQSHKRTVLVPLHVGLYLHQTTDSVCCGRFAIPITICHHNKRHTNVKWIIVRVCVITTSNWQCYLHLIYIIIRPYNCQYYIYQYNYHNNNWHTYNGFIS